MNCQNFLCIYQKDGVCSLKEIELDTLGQCSSCIYIKLTDKELESAKKRTLEHLDNKNR